MSVPAFLRSVWIYAVLCFLCLATGPARAQSDAASRAADQQFAAAAGLHNRQAFDLAADEWAKFLKDFPNDKRTSEARHYLGICRLQKQDYAGAVTVLKELAAADPKFEQIAASQLYLGLAQFNLARSGKNAEYAAAEKTLSKLLADHPEGKHVAQALYYQGEAQYAQNKKTEAVASYEKFVAEHGDDPLLPDALYALGVALDETGKKPEAAKAYNNFSRKVCREFARDRRRCSTCRVAGGGGKVAAAEKLFARGAADKDYDAADYACFAKQAVFTTKSSTPTPPCSMRHSRNDFPSRNT